MKGIRKRLDLPSDQYVTITKIINALLNCYKRNNNEFFYEKTITHEFYYQLRKQVLNHIVIPEFPVKGLLEDNDKDERFDFFLFNNNYTSSDNIILEFKKNEYNINNIKKDLKKLEKVSEKHDKGIFRESIRPIFINFHTKPLDFTKYINIIHNAYANSEIRVLTVAPSIEINSLHKKVKNKDGSTAVNINRKCVITNYQRLLDYKMVNNSTPVILHPRLNGLVKRTLLYNVSDEKIIIDDE